MLLPGSNQNRTDDVASAAPVIPGRYLVEIETSFEYGKKPHEVEERLHRKCREGKLDGPASSIPALEKIQNLKRSFDKKVRIEAASPFRANPLTEGADLSEARRQFVVLAGKDGQVDGVGGGLHGVVQRAPGRPEG